MTLGRSLFAALALRGAIRCTAPACVLLVVAWSGPALAAPGTETAEDLRNELLAGQSLGEWNSTMRVILERPAEQVGAILGELFTDPEHSKKVDMLAAVGGYLAHHPKGSRVLLAEFILRRAAASDGSAFLARLEQPMEPDRVNGRRRPDWDRLQDAAAEILARPAAPRADREAALTFLVREQGSRITWVLSLLEAEARRQAAVTAPSPEDVRLTGALCTALERLLAYPFESAAQAAQLLEATHEMAYIERLKHFSHLKDAGVHDREIARKYLRAHIHRADTPALLALAAADAARYPDLLAEALRRAGELKPRPVPEWSEFFATLFAAAGEPDLVLAALDRLAESGFGGGPSDCCSPVADAIQSRLVARRPADPPAVRVRLVSMLGDLASLGAVARQVAVALGRGAPGADEIPEWVELVTAVGKCPGAVVADQLKPFYVLPAASAEAREALRTAVARALGSQGVRKGDGPSAVRALTGMLAGTDGWEQATLPKVREAALRSLGAYPAAETAALLLGISEASGADQEGEANIALETLGKMTSSGAARHHGASALVVFLERSRERTDIESRRTEALKLLRRVKNDSGGDPLPGDVREAVSGALRDVLQRGTDAERTQAARTAAELAEPSALLPLAAWWAEQPAAPRSELLRGLLEAVVRAAPREAAAAGAPDPDALVAEALRVVSKAQPATAVEWAEVLARSGARPGAPRVPLLVAHAEALLARAATAEPGAGGSAKRRDDLAAARGILTPVHQGARAPEDAEQTRRVLLEVLEGLVAEVESAEEKKGLLLEAVALAARSTVIAALQTGIRLGEQLGSDEDLRASLTPQERAELDGQLASLRANLERR